MVCKLVLSWWTFSFSQNVRLRRDDEQTEEIEEEPKKQYQTKNETQQYFVEIETHLLERMGFGSLWVARGVECQAIVKKVFGFDCFVTLPKALTECLMSWICVVNNTKSQQHIWQANKNAHTIHIYVSSIHLQQVFVLWPGQTDGCYVYNGESFLRITLRLLWLLKKFLGFKHFSHANWQPMTTFNAEIMMRPTTITNA